MTPAPATLQEADPMEDVMRKFDETGADILPVVDVNNVLVGYISRTKMYAAYRKMVEDLSSE